MQLLYHLGHQNLEEEQLIEYEAKLALIYDFYVCKFVFLQVDASGKAPLKPFEGGEDLINKSIRCFERLRPHWDRSGKWR